MAANADVAVERAARLGIPWFVNPHADYDTIARQVALYRKAAREAGHPADISLPAMRELYCAETTEQALLEAAPYVGAKYAAYADWGQDKTISPTEDFRRELAKLMEGRFIIGSPDDCAAELARWEALGLGPIVLRMHWSGTPFELSLKSLRLFGEHVIPRFRKKSAGRAPVEIPKP